jgi:hypothetical protein
MFVPRIRFRQVETRTFESQLFRSYRGRIQHHQSFLCRGRGRDYDVRVKQP